MGCGHSPGSSSQVTFTLHRVMNLRQSNKNAHPGLPDLPSSQQHSSQQVADDCEAKVNTKAKREKILSKQCQEIARFEKYRDELAAKGKLQPMDLGTKIPWARIKGKGCSQPIAPPTNIEDAGAHWTAYSRDSLPRI